MTEKEHFVTLAQTGRFTVAELCVDFGISRKTGHKYLKRYRADGRDGLPDRSRRPKHSPNATVKSVEALILKERRKHPTWGPKKIRDLLIKAPNAKYKDLSVPPTSRQGHLVIFALRTFNKSDSTKSIERPHLLGSFPGMIQGATSRLRLMNAC